MCVICWGLSIGFVLGGVVMVYCMKSGCKMDLEVIKSSLGFKIGSGPDNTAYKIWPDAKWLICYFAYAFLQTVLILVENLKVSLREIEKNIRDNVVFLRLLTLGLIFVAARHSSLVDYNAGGLMLKLLGRYVAYVALIEIIIYGICVSYKREKKPSTIGMCISAFILVACTVFCYAILYKRILWNPADDWLVSLRGLENIAFYKLGSIFLLFICVEIILLVIYGKKFLLVCWVIFASINVCCSIDANEVYSENHNYIRTTRELINEYGDYQISVYSTDMEKYIGALQSFGFLYHYQLKGESWFLQAGFTDSPMNMMQDRVNFFTICKSTVDMEQYERFPSAIIGTENSNVFYFRFDKELFEEKTQNNSIKVFEKDNEIVVKCDQTQSDVILVINGMIMPCKKEDSSLVYCINKKTLDNISEATIYNFSDLTLMNIEL